MTGREVDSRPGLERFARFVFGRRDELRSRRFGRLLAAILLVGLFATPWAGQTALLVAIVVTGAVMLVGLALDGAAEIGDASKRRGSRIVIAIEYGVLALVAGAALVGFAGALPTPEGSIEVRIVLRILVLVWIAFTWFAPWVLASRTESIAARRRRAAGALAVAAVGLVLLVAAADGRARTADVVAGAALILVSAAYTFRSHLFSRS